jgi:hypothetical protein
MVSEVAGGGVGDARGAAVGLIMRRRRFSLAAYDVIARRCRNE